jgi:hypothetical protein
MFRVSAIGVIAGIARVAAQIFVSTPAELAGAIHMPQPCDADPQARPFPAEPAATLPRATVVSGSSHA